MILWASALVFFFAMVATLYSRYVNSCGSILVGGGCVLRNFQCFKFLVRGASWGKLGI